MNTVIVRAVASDDVDPQAFDARAADGFTGMVGDTRIEQHGDRVVAITGIGMRGQAEERTISRAAAAIGRRLSRSVTAGREAASVTCELDLRSFAVPALSTEKATAQVVAGILAGGYRFRMTGETSFVSAQPLLAIPAVRDAGWRRGEMLAAAISSARDLVNLPASALSPEGFARRASALLEPEGVRVSVLTEGALIDEGYGGIVAMGKGSVNPPVLLELSVGSGPPELAFVGKGVTFDSGGLSLKSPDALMTMKSDMAGAAAVVGAFTLLPALAPGRSFAAVIPLVENMLGPASVRPGDVARLRNGATVEILNTDFEGRVILADGLARAAERTPGAIVDIASLTYAAAHALGEGYAALVATDDALAARLLEAGVRSGDRLWRMPLQPDLAPQIVSAIADYKNFPGVPDARVSSAALLLSRMVGDTPWAHLDITGPCFRAAEDRFGAAGGTGFGVRLLAELVGEEPHPDQE